MRDVNEKTVHLNRCGSSPAITSISPSFFPKVPLLPVAHLDKERTGTGTDMGMGMALVLVVVLDCKSKAL